MYKLRVDSTRSQNQTQVSGTGRQQFYCCTIVPQGNVLGPLLFVIYINNLDVNVGRFVRRFADDTKIAGVVDLEEACHSIQQE